MPQRFLENLCGSFKPEGNLLRDRFLSFQHRALIEPRVPVLYVFLVHASIYTKLFFLDPNGEEPRLKNTKNTLGRDLIKINRFSMVHVPSFIYNVMLFLQFQSQKRRLYS